jgi:hypothetical protein
MSAADLAHLVADPAVERSQADRSASDVSLPQDMLPGSSEEAMSLREGLRTAGSRTFLVLAIIVTLDNLQSSGTRVLAPNIQSSFHVSTSVIVFVAGISGGFLVLGIVPMGWLADRYRRAPIVGWATAIFGVMVAATGFATNIFVFFLARFGAGVSQASTTASTARCSPTPTPSRCAGGSARPWESAGRGHGAQPSPRRLDRHRRWVDRTAGGGPSTSWRSPFCWLPSSPSACPSHHAGSSRRRTCLGEVLADTPPAAPSLEAAFERVMRIRTIKTVLIAFSAIGFGLFTVPVLGNLYLKQRFGLDAFQRGSSAPSEVSGCWSSCPWSGATTTASTARTRRRPCP